MMPFSNYGPRGGSGSAITAASLTVTLANCCTLCVFSGGEGGDRNNYSVIILVEFKCSVMTWFHFRSEHFLGDLPADSAI